MLSLNGFLLATQVGLTTRQTEQLICQLNQYLTDIPEIFHRPLCCLLLDPTTPADGELAEQIYVHPLAVKYAVKHVVQKLAAIAQSGFSSQWTHKEFVKKYRVLFSKAAIQPDKIRRSFETLLSSIQPNPTKFWIGHTMLFLKENTMQ
jgi:hypothetical protein